MVAGIRPGFPAAGQIDPEPLAIRRGFAMMGTLNLPPEGLGMGPVPCRAFSLSILSACQPPGDWDTAVGSVLQANLCRAVLVIALGVICPGCQRQPTLIRPFEGISINRDQPAVEIEAWACLEAGWLEQIACSPHTREHESLLVVQARPSDIHAALLLAGFEPGKPGSWTERDGEVQFTPPTGDPLVVFVRYLDIEGGIVEEPIRMWIEDEQGRVAPPTETWVFTGSIMATNPRWMDPGEHYVADITGSIVGLVTFGDEVVGFRQVLADRVDVQPPQWKVRCSHVPPLGTPATMILRGSDKVTKYPVADE